MSINFRGVATITQKRKYTFGLKMREDYITGLMDFDVMCIRRVRRTSINLSKSNFGRRISSDKAYIFSI